MWKQKKTKWTTFLARYHDINISCKTLWILILALPLYTLDIFCCIQQNWQVHSPIFHRHSHQAWLQIRSQCLTRFPRFGGTSYSLLFSSSFHDFCFPMFVHSFSFHLLGFEFDQLWESPGHKVILEWGGTGPSQVGNTARTGSFWHKSTKKDTWGNQCHQGKQCQLKNKHLKKSLVSNWILDSHLQKVDFYHLTYFHPTVGSQFFPDGNIS